MTAKSLIKNQSLNSRITDSLEYGFFIHDEAAMRNRYNEAITLKGNDNRLFALLSELTELRSDI